MQITNVEVTPVVLNLRQPIKMAPSLEIESVTAIFIRMETRSGKIAWGCTIAHEALTGEKPEFVTQTCRDCADIVPDLPPTNIEYSLSKIAPFVKNSRAVLCAFDLAFHDLLGLEAGMPLYRILGGYRNRIQTSVTIPISSVNESVEIARSHASSGFRILKVKGGLDPAEDARRIQAIYRALPDIKLRLDADGGYTIPEALDISRALSGKVEILEQPTSPNDIESLRQVTEHSPIPILADQSVAGPGSALQIAAGRKVDGMSVKLAACGGFRCARQVDAIARAADIATMVSCLFEPSLLIAAGLHFALGSPNVQFGDLDGHLDFINDPTVPGFKLEEGWLIASEMPGLGCTVDLN